MKSEFARYKEVKGTPGLTLGRLIQALAVGRGDLIRARAFAEENYKGMPWMSDLITRSSVAAGSTSDALWAQPIALPSPLGTELVKLLYPTDILLQLLARGARRLPFNCLFPRVNTGASSSWVAAGKPEPVSKDSLDTANFGITKTGGIQILTSELARSPLLDSASMVAADMVESLAKFRNRSAFDPDFAGVFQESPASLTYGLSQIQSSGTSIDNLSDDAGRAMNQLTDGGVPLVNAVWVMSERLAGYISRLRTTTKALAFPTMSAKGGTWFGLDVLTSGAEVESSSPSESFFVLLDVGSVAIAQDDTPLINVTKETSLQMLTDPSTGATTNVSLWQQGLIAVRALVATKFLRRRDVAFAIVRGINI